MGASIANRRHAACGRDERTQPREAVGRDQSSRDTSAPIACRRASSSSSHAAPRSLKNDAPRVLQYARSTRRARSDKLPVRSDVSASSRRSRCQTSVCSRRNNATGVAGTRRGRIQRIIAGLESRAQPTSPARHSMSSSCGS